MIAYIEPGGCELLCEDCCSSEAQGYPDGGGESDSPQHCGVCGEPLGNPLTPDGVRYVLEEARRESKDPDRYRIIPKAGTAEEEMVFYHGTPHCQIVLDWLEQLQWYALDEAEARRRDRLVAVLERRR